MPSLTAKQIADAVNGKLIGSAEVVLTNVASLAEASEDSLSFLSNPKYRVSVSESRAGAILVPPSFRVRSPAGRAWILCDNPSAAFTTALTMFAPPPARPPPGVHPTAVIAADARIPASCHIGPFVVVETGVAIGENSIVMAGCYIGHETRLGEDCLLYPGVVIRERCIIGERVIIHPGSVIGSDGFGYEPDISGHNKIPQLGIVRIDGDVEIGACVTIDRARFGRTWIQRGVKIDNLCQIAHNVTIGEHSVVMAQVGIAGSSTIGRLVALYGQVGIPGHVTIGDRAQVKAKSGVYGAVEPGQVVMGIPARPDREFLKQQAALRQLPDLRRRVHQLEQALRRLEARDQYHNMSTVDDAAEENRTQKRFG